MTSNKYLPVLVSGFGAGVLSVVPIIKTLNCCLIIPAAAILALLLYQRTILNGAPLSFSNSLSVGLLTGIVAAFFASGFEILITFVTHTNDLVTGLPQSEEFMRQFNLGDLLDQSIVVMREMVEDIKRNGFSALYTIIIISSNLFIFSIFGMLGGLLGMVILNKRSRRNF